MIGIIAPIHRAFDVITDGSHGTSLCDNSARTPTPMSRIAVVKSCKTKVRAVGNDVKIEVRVVTAPTVSLLEMTHTLQDEIDAAILSFCGTKVGRVDVTVDQAEIPPKRT